MKRLAQALSALALVGTVLPPCLLLGGGMSLAAVKGWMLAAAVLWFVATPFWMERKGTD